ncbi:MAG: amidase domain-containing protein [Pirellulaceae bacterium]|nr:amidase domain-containing protein [Pirellulaceae bacterium]
MPSFDRYAARDYATKYALTANSDYPPFDNDCTSFVSQCMFQGGWTMLGGSFSDRKSDDVWWWGKSWWTKASYTWGGAHNFSKFVTASGRGKSCRRDELEVGDVVQISKDKHVFHSMLVTVAGTELKVSFHTTNTLNKPLATIEASYPSSGGNAFLYWKILSNFTK